MKTTYEDVQTLPGWNQQSGVAISGSANGAAPTQYGYIEGVPGAPTAMLLYAEGTTKPGVTADWLAGGLALPLPPGWQGNLTMSYQVTFDALAHANLFAWESDTIVIDAAGYKYNLSAQVRIATGELDINNAAQLWVDSTIRVPVFQPGVAHQIEFTYAVDTVKRTFSVLSYSIDGQSFAVPAALQGVAASLSTWQKGIILPQLQQDTNGLQTTALVDHLTYVAW